MEPVGAISELNWNFSDESEVLLAQLLSPYPDMNEQDQEASFGVEAMFWPDQGASSYTLLGNLSSCWPCTSNNTVVTSSFFFPTSEFQSYEMGDLSAVSANSMDYFTSEEQMTGSSLIVEDLICSKDDENELKDNVGSTTAEAVALADVTLQAKRKLLEPRNDNKDDVIPTESPKKKSRASVQVKIAWYGFLFNYAVFFMEHFVEILISIIWVQVQKNAKNARSKKAQKNAGTGEEALSNASCSSEDESNTSQELTEGASSSSKGKTRAGHGSATDPQSLYAKVSNFDSDITHNFYSPQFLRTPFVFQNFDAIAILVLLTEEERKD